MTALGKYFYRMVTKCGWTLEQVPAYWRGQVITQLEKDAEEAAAAEAVKQAEQEAQNNGSTPEDNTDAGEDTVADGEETTE